MQNGGNTNVGNAANRFYQNSSKVYKTLGLPNKRLLVLTLKLLNAINKTSGFPDIEAFKINAAKAHRYRRFVNTNSVVKILM